MAQVWRNKFNCRFCGWKWKSPRYDTKAEADAAYEEEQLRNGGEIECPNCKGMTPDSEDETGEITCKNCGKPFKKGKSTQPDYRKQIEEAFNQFHKTLKF